MPPENWPSGCLFFDGQEERTCQRSHGTSGLRFTAAPKQLRSESLKGEGNGPPSRHPQWVLPRHLCRLSDQRVPRQTTPSKPLSQPAGRVARATGLGQGCHGGAPQSGFGRALRTVRVVRRLTSCPGRRQLGKLPIMSSAQLLAIATAVVSLSFTAPALAVCARPQEGIIWSYPAEGATDVPTDARLFILMNQFNGLLRHPVVVNGELLNLDPNDTALGINLHLQPNQAYVIELPPLGHPSPPTLRFTTGATAAPDSPPAPPVVDRATALQDRVLSSTCLNALFLGTCFDIGRPEHLVLETRSRPLFFALDQSQPGAPPHTIIWPAECGAPEVFGWGGSCAGRFRITAVGPTGQSASADFICEPLPTPASPDPPRPPTLGGGPAPEGSAAGRSAAGVPSGAQSAAGCHAAGRPGAMSLIFLLLPAAGLALASRARSPRSGS